MSAGPSESLDEFTARYFKGELREDQKAALRALAGETRSAHDANYAALTVHQRDEADKTNRKLKPGERRWRKFARRNAWLKGTNA